MRSLRCKKYNGKVLLFGNVNYEDGTSISGATVILEGFCPIGYAGGKYPKCKNCKYNKRSYCFGVRLTNKYGKFSFVIKNKNICYRVRVFDDLKCKKS
jgi:hypothetical protein